MTLAASHQNISEIMEAIANNVQCDQLINKLADKHIITSDDVSNLNMLEDKDKMKELLIILLGKDPKFYPLILKILETYKHPGSTHVPRTTSAIARTRVADRNDSEKEKGSDTVATVSNERKRLTSADVSEDWELKSFLMELSHDITEEDLNNMKDMMLGETGFKASQMEKITRPMELFRHMMTTRRLNAYNLISLQALMKTIRRHDLNVKVRQFCLESHRKPIHFFIPDHTPENGYKYVKYHVDGNIEDLNHRQKERLRADVATLLCTDLKSVIIAGIEPSSSLMFTFMVPEEDVVSFMMYVQHGGTELSVCIQIRGEDLALSEHPEDGVQDDSRLLHQLQNLLEREQGLKKQIEDRDDILLDLQKALDRTEEETTLDQTLHGEDQEGENVRELKSQVEFFKSVFRRMVEFLKTRTVPEIKNGDNGFLSSLKLRSASTMYRHQLEQARKTFGEINMGVINKLLDVKGVVESYRHDEKLRKMRSLVDIFAERVDELTEECVNLRMSNVVIGGPASFLQDVLAVQTHRRDVALEQRNEEYHGIELSGILEVQLFHGVLRDPSNIKVDPDLHQTLDKMTHALTQKERSRLKTFLCFSESEKEELKIDQWRLLEIALLRELRKGRQEPFDIILEEILARIKKKDLVRRYLSLPGSPYKPIKRGSSERRMRRRIPDSPQKIAPESDEGSATGKIIHV